MRFFAAVTMSFLAVLLVHMEKSWAQPSTGIDIYRCNAIHFDPLSAGLTKDAILVATMPNGDLGFVTHVHPSMDLNQIFSMSNGFPAYFHSRSPESNAIYRADLEGSTNSEAVFNTQFIGTQGFGHRYYVRWVQMAPHHLPRVFNLDLEYVNYNYGNWTRAFLCIPFGTL